MISNQSLACPKGASLTFEIDMDTGSDLTGATAQWALCESWFDQAKVYLTKTGSSDGLFIGQDAGVWKITVNLAPTDTLDIPSGLLYHDCKVLLQSGDVEDVANGPFSLDPSVNILLTNAPITRNVHAVQLLGRLGQNVPLTVSQLVRNLLAAQTFGGLGQSITAVEPIALTAAQTLAGIGQAATAMGAVSPVFQADFIALASLPAEISFFRADNSMVTDATGSLTYAPNNLLTYSADLTNAAWTLSNATIAGGVADSLGGNNAFTLTATGAAGYIRQVPSVGGANALNQVWLRRRTGTGTTQLFLPNSAGNGVTLTSSWQQFAVTSAATPGQVWFLIQCDTSGDAIDIFQPQAQLVTYETTPRAYNLTTSSPYHGPRFDHAWTYVPNNILLHSEDLTDAVWNAASGGTTRTATTAQFTGTNDYIYQTVPTVTGNVYILSALLSSAAKATINLHVNGISGILVNLTSMPTRYYLKFTAGGNDLCGLDNRVSGGGDGIAGTVTATDWQVEQVTYETSPRTYNPTTTAAYYGSGNGSLTLVVVATGLLIEEQRTNEALSSNNFSSGDWGTNGITPIALVTTSPDGTLNAWKLKTNGLGASNRFIYQAINSSIADGHVCTITIYAKQAEARYFYLGFNNDTGDAATSFDLQTGAKGSNFGAALSQFLSSSIQSFGNGWYRLQVTATIVGTAYLLIGIADNMTTTGSSRPDYTAATTEDGAYISFADFELGSFATSYIPTTTAAVTRSADIVQFTGAALTAFTGAAYSVVIKISDTQPSYYAAYLYSEGAAGVLREILGQRANLTSQVTSGNGIFGDTELIADLGSGSTAGPLQIAFGIDASGRSLAGNGGTVATDTFNPSHSTTAVYISSGFGFAANMHCAGVAIYSSRLSDADLQTKSVVGAAFGSAPSPDWYVDSVAGSDSNTGTSSSAPFATLAKVNSVVVANPTQKWVALKRGGYWRELLGADTDGSPNSWPSGSKVTDYGSGVCPVIDGTNIAANGSFSLTGGQTKTYQISWGNSLPTFSGKEFFTAWENGTRLLRATSIANCEATAGSCYAPDPTGTSSQLIYVHATDNSNVSSNGKTYEITARLYAIGFPGVSGCTVASAVDGTVGLRVRRGGSNNGSIELGTDATLKGVISQEGRLHNFLLANGIATDCYSWKLESGAGGTGWVAFANDATGLSMSWTRCYHIGDTTYPSPDGEVGFYAHSGGGPSTQYASLSFTDCFGYYCFQAIDGLANAITVTRAGTQKVHSPVATGTNSLTVDDCYFINDHPAGGQRVFAPTGLSGTITNIRSEMVTAFQQWFLGAGTWSVSNCTIINSVSGYSNIVENNGALTTGFHHNICKGTHNNLSSASGLTLGTWDNNDYFDDGGGEYWTLNGSLAIGLAAWKTASSKETGSISSDPSFAGNPSTGDFTLNGGSPAAALAAGATNDPAKGRWAMPVWATVISNMGSW